MKKQFITEGRGGRKAVLYAGLLDEAHSKYQLTSITTEVIQLPTPDNGMYAVCKAHVTIVRDERVCVFEGLGDASPDSLPRIMLPHCLRMAETRAKARALRDAINVGEVAAEELGDQGGGRDPDDDDLPEYAPAPAQGTPGPEDRSTLLTRWSLATQTAAEHSVEIKVPPPNDRDSLRTVKAKVEAVERAVGIRGRR